MSGHTPTVAAQPPGSLHRIPRSRLAKSPSGRPDMVAVGTFVWLASDLMFFAALFAAYFTIRNVTNAQAAMLGQPSLWENMTTHLNLPFALVNTTILVLSSVTCQLGVIAAEEMRPGRTDSVWKFWRWGMREWYILTVIMGSVFVGGQIWEYAELIGSGVTIDANPWASAFFLATGFHGIHVTAGLISFILVLARSYLARTYTHEQSVSAVAVSYYWHFVDVVWIALFLTIYIIK